MFKTRIIPFLDWYNNNNIEKIFHAEVIMIDLEILKLKK